VRTDPPTSRCLWLAVALAHLSCTAYRLPDSANAAPPGPAPAFGAAVIDRSHLPAYLRPEQADAFLSRLRADLVATGLFESVEIAEAPGDGLVLVRAEYEPRRCFSEPLITVITLGIVPYPGCYASGYRMTLSGGRLSRDIAVDNRSNPLALWGWLAGPISLLPGWSRTLPEEQERQNLRVAIQSAIGGVQ
jgi:hypothetical protein